MTLTRTLKTLRMSLLICLAIHLFSCDNSMDLTDDPQSVKVLKVEAETSFDLSSRSDWDFIVGTYPYAFSVDGSKIIATPAGESSTFAFSVTSTDKSGRVTVKLRHKNYYRTRDTGPVFANLEDQSTPEKFMMRDVLCGDYQAEASETVTVSLFHENALLIFKTEGLPENAEVYVEQLLHHQVVTPLRDKNHPTEYKALVFPENNENYLAMIAKVDGKIYNASFASSLTRMNISYPHNAIGHSSIVEFTLEFTEEKELIIKDVKRTAFVREWPITQ